MKKVVALTISVLALAFPAGAGAKGKTFVVGETAVRWSSPERYARDELVNVRLSYRGRDLAWLEVKRNCVFDYTGYGLVVRVWACDNGSKPSPLRLRLASARENAAKVKLTYWR